VRRLIRCCARAAAGALWFAACFATSLHAQGRPLQVAQEGPITQINLGTGRSFPITTAQPITRISVADTTVADVVVISDHELVINGKKSGETDAILWVAGGPRQQYRVQVRSASDRQQIVLYVRFAEVRRDLIRSIGNSALYRDQHTRAGTGIFNTDIPFTKDQFGRDIINLPADAKFGTVLTDFGTKYVLDLLQLEEQTGRARVLAAPNLMAANREEATFLAGGELPIPVVQGGAVGSTGPTVGIQYHEFGVKLRFIGEIVSDSLLKLTVTPEVSTLDYSNAVTISGFRIPAFSTRRMSSTLDVRRDESLIISGMFDNEVDQVKTGLPLLKDLPILGTLFSSTDFQRHETELIVVVTPVVIDPNHPRPIDVSPVKPDTAQPAVDALKRQPPMGGKPPIQYQ
jgi:pilus assembly protein CpaC